MSTNPLIIIAALGSGAIAVAIGVNVIQWQDETRISPASITTTASDKALARNPITTTASDKALARNPIDVKNKNNETQGLPAFDVVRIGPDGNSVIAGRAISGSTVVIMDDNKPIGKIIADERGEWVFLPKSSLPPGTRKLSLKMIQPSGDSVISEEVVLLVVPEKGKDIAGVEAKDAGALAIKIPINNGSSILMQNPGGPRPKGLSIETIDYGDTGSLTIKGKADAMALVNIYLGDDFIGQAKATKQGLWQLIPNEMVEPGLYTLRADQVNDTGKVIARISIPFSRAEPTTNVQLEPVVIVQPGNSLWRLAYKAYGRGTQYTTIFLANKDQIKDPDLIYPGQVFAMPAGN